MKVKFNLWERNELTSLLDNIQFAGGVSLGQIDMALALKNKVEYSGKKEDLDFDTELTLDKNEITLLKQKAFSIQGWGINERTKQLKERLEKYAEEVGEN